MKPRRLVALAAAAAALFVSSLAGAAGFHATHTSDGVDVWAVGDGGVIYRSLTGGTAWTQHALGDEHLRGVAAVGLTAIVVSDSGKIWRSVNSGGSWAITVVTGATDLLAVAMPSASVAYVAGESGKIWKSVNGGATWSPQTTGTSETLRALDFTDADHGWAVGDNGKVLRTSNGGASWSSVSVGTSKRLLAVDQSGSTIWIGGEDAACVKSTNDGGSWSPVNLKFDDYSDVRVVRLASASTVFLAGGGGFIRVSSDGGSTWDFKKHSIHARITAATFFGDDIWVVNADNRVVSYSLNDGTTWSFPSGASLTRGWNQVTSTIYGTVRGSTLLINPQNKHSFFAIMGDKVIKSVDDGETWTQIRDLAVSKTNAFLISPKDSNLWLAAFDSSGVDWVGRSTNAGASWTKVLWGQNGGPTNFGNYGIPLEMNPDKPDTVLFGGESADAGTMTNTKLFRTTNFGLTWSEFGNQGFRSPCDIVITPDNNNIVHVGDGITSSGSGRVWRSTDGGVNFSSVLTTPGSNSEVPGMSTSRLRNNVVFASAWNAGGLFRSTNSGASYTEVNTQVSGWGTAVCKEDPNVVLYGTYSGNDRFLSIDGGDTWTNYETPNAANYSFYARDRATIFTEDADHIRKMTFNYSYTPSGASQSVTVTSPNGGENWSAGSIKNITWTAAGLAAVRIEYRKTSADAWQLVAEVPGYQQTYAWTVPSDATSDARVRVMDLWDGSPTDQSNNPFTITSPAVIELLDPDGGEVWQYGTAHEIVWNSVSVAQVDLEYRTTDVGDWIPIAAGVAAGPGAYVWNIPDAATSTARVRISETGGGVLDMSAAPFSITVPLLEVLDDPVHLGGVLPGGQLGGVIQISNPGTAPLTISSATEGHAKFWLGRASLVVPAGDDDTLGVFYKSLVESADTTLVTLAADHPGASRMVKVIAYSVPSLAAGDPVPTSFALWQNQPNPFTRATTIRYALPVAASVSLEVYDVQGHRVATLARGAQGPGQYAVSFGRGMADADGRPLAGLRAGVYFARFQAGTFSATRKMLLMQ